MKSYLLKRGGKVEGQVLAENIDQALDHFFSQIAVEVDLETASPTRLDVRPLHARESTVPYRICEQKRHDTPRRGGS